MDRRDFLAGLGQAAAVVAACAQGCEGEASEPPDLARGDAQGRDPQVAAWWERGRGGAVARHEDRVDGTSRVRVEMCDGTEIGTSWPHGTVPTIVRHGDVLVLTGEWDRQCAWFGRELRRRGNRIEQYVFGEGTWELVGEA